jgi:hypothetical protein
MRMAINGHRRDAQRPYVPRIRTNHLIKLLAMAPAASCAASR